MLSLRLKLLLLYLKYIRRNRNYGDMPPAKIRAYNKKNLPKEQQLIAKPPVEMHHIEDRQIAMRDGESIPIRIYKPSDQQNLTTIVFFHGGGFVLRSIDTHDRVCRRTAKLNNAVVVSIGYRLAPEYKFPTPSNDCYDATVWVAQNATSLGGNPDQLIVMGDSAGGNLATVTAIQARDLGTPKIAKQVLIYPTTDARLNHPSIEKFSEGYFLTKELMQWFVDHYKATDEDILNPIMSPLLTKDLTNLPPAFVTVSDHDPLKDEGEAYYKALKKAGNHCQFKEYKSTIHGFANMTKLTKQAARQDYDIQQFISN